MEGEGEQGSEKWKQERKGKLNASKVDDYTGMSPHISAQERWYQMVHLPDKEEDPNDDMEAGTANEDPLALEAARMLELRPDQLRQPRSFSHLFYPFIRASPDRLISGFEAQPWLMIECKFSRYKLAPRPKVSHLVQTCVQMQVLCADHCFLACGYREGCTKEGKWVDGGEIRVRLFYVEYSELLWRWLLRRMLIFERCKRERRRPTEQEIPHLGRAVLEYWETGQLPKWLARKYPEIERDRPDWLRPPQPLWKILGENFS